MSSASQNPTLGEAASRFLASLPAQDGEKSQQAVYGFVRWYGAKRTLTELTAHEVENYTARLSSAWDLLRLISAASAIRPCGLVRSCRSNRVRLFGHRRACGRQSLEAVSLSAWHRRARAFMSVWRTWAMPT